MNQELQKALAAWLQAALGAVQNVAGQIPPMLWEKVAWGRAVHLAEAVLAVAVFVALVKIGVWGWRTASAERGERFQIFVEKRGGMVSVLALIGATLSLAGFVFSAESALEAWIAPRVYLMEWLRGLL